MGESARQDTVCLGWQERDERPLTREEMQADQKHTEGGRPAGATKSRPDSIRPRCSRRLPQVARLADAHECELREWLKTHSPA